MWETQRKMLESSFANAGRDLKAWAAFTSYFLSAGFQTLCPSWKPEGTSHLHSIPSSSSPSSILWTRQFASKPCPPSKHVHHRENKLRVNICEVPGRGSGPFGQGTLVIQVPKCGLEVGAQTLGIPLALKPRCPRGVTRPYRNHGDHGKLGTQERSPYCMRQRMVLTSRKRNGYW